jgi:hypothetical protein
MAKVVSRAMRAAFLPLIAAVLLALVPAAARADDPPETAVRLSYVVVGPGTKSCPPEQALHDEVARRMGFDPFKPDAPDRIVATLKPSARGVMATVERFDSKDVPQWRPKTNETRDCAALVTAMGIYISFMLLPPVVPPEAATLTPSPSPTSSSDVSPDPPKVEPTPPHAPDSPEVDEPTPRRSDPLQSLVPPSPRRWAVRLAISGGFGFGVAPADVAAVLSAEGGVQWRLTPDWVFSGALGVLYSPRASAAMPAEMSREQVEIGTTLVTSVLAPCVHKHIFFGWVFGCVGLELGSWRGDRAQIPHPASAVILWAAVAPRLGIEVPLPHAPKLAVRVFGDLPVPLVRPRALVGEGPSMSGGRITQMWEAPAVTGAVSLGLVGWFDP